MRSRIKVVLDTNIFIKGWFGDDPHCQRIMDWTDQRKLYLSFGQDTIGELMYMVKNFARHNLKGDKDAQVRMLENVAKLFLISTSVNTMDTIYEPSNDKYDDMFLKCAIEGEVDYLVTDDLRSGLHKKDYPFRIVTSDKFCLLMDRNEE